MSQITTPIDADQFKNKRIWNEQHQEYEYETVYSKRCGVIDEYNRSAQLIDVWREIHARDDFGLVELVTEVNGKSIFMKITKTNMGFDIAAWVDGEIIPYFMANGHDSIDYIIKKHL